MSILKIIKILLKISQYMKNILILLTIYIIYDYNNININRAIDNFI